MLFISKMPINDKGLLSLPIKYANAATSLRSLMTFDVGDMSAPKFHTDNDVYQFMFIPAVSI